MSDPRFTIPLEHVAALLSQLGGVLLSSEPLETTVKLVAELARETIGGSVGAGVTLVDVRGRRTSAATDSLTEQADLMQYELESGPCLTAWQEQVTVRIDDVNRETRWPQWTTQVARRGLGSTLSVPLVAAGTAIGAMKVYARRAGAYDARAEQLLQLVARPAAILLANALTLADAQEARNNAMAALEYRDVIGQAKGILIAQGAAHQDEAFAMLAAASQRSNMKLHDVARQLVASVESRNAGRAAT